MPPLQSYDSSTENAELSSIATMEANKRELKSNQEQKVRSPDDECQIHKPASSIKAGNLPITEASSVWVDSSAV